MKKGKFELFNVIGWISTRRGNTIYTQPIIADECGCDIKNFNEEGEDIVSIFPARDNTFIVYGEEGTLLGYYIGSLKMFSLVHWREIEITLAEKNRGEEQS